MYRTQNFNSLHHGELPYEYCAYHTVYLASQSNATHFVWAMSNLFRYSELFKYFPYRGNVVMGDFFIMIVQVSEEIFWKKSQAAMTFSANLALTISGAVFAAEGKPFP